MIIIVPIANTVNHALIEAGMQNILSVRNSSSLMRLIIINLMEYILKQRDINKKLQNNVIVAQLALNQNG